MTRDEMLDKAMASDGAYDRVFITGVLSTGIYCLPSCRARKPKPENVELFSSIDEAKDAGLRACKKCRPDEFFAGIDLDLDSIEAVLGSLRENPQSIVSITDLAEAAKVGTSKLFADVRK